MMCINMKARQNIWKIASILSDNIRYIYHDERPKTTCRLDVKTLDYWQHKRLYLNLKGEESQTIDVDFAAIQKQ